MTISSTLKPAWFAGRPASVGERITALPFPRPLSHLLLAGFPHASSRWSAASASPSRFLRLLEEMPAAVPESAVVIDFAPDNEVWLRLAKALALSPALREQLASPPSLKAARELWRGTRDFFDEWEVASRSLSRHGRGRNLLRLHKVLHPERWSEDS